MDTIIQGVQNLTFPSQYIRQFHNFSIHSFYIKSVLVCHFAVRKVLVSLSFIKGKWERLRDLQICKMTSCDTALCHHCIGLGIEQITFLQGNSIILEPAIFRCLEQQKSIIYVYKQTIIGDSSILKDIDLTYFDLNRGNILVSKLCIPT